MYKAFNFQPLILLWLLTNAFITNGNDITYLFTTVAICNDVLHNSGDSKCLPTLGLLPLSVDLIDVSPSCLAAHAGLHQSSPAALAPSPSPALRTLTCSPVAPYFKWKGIKGLQSFITFPLDTHLWVKLHLPCMLLGGFCTVSLGYNMAWKGEIPLELFKEIRFFFHLCKSYWRFYMVLCFSQLGVFVDEGEQWWSRLEQRPECWAASLEGFLGVGDSGVIRNRNLILEVIWKNQRALYYLFCVSLVWFIDS